MARRRPKNLHITVPGLGPVTVSRYNHDGAEGSYTSFHFRPSAGVMELDQAKLTASCIVLSWQIPALRALLAALDEEAASSRAET